MDYEEKGINTRKLFLQDFAGVIVSKKNLFVKGFKKKGVCP